MVPFCRGYSFAIIGRRGDGDEGAVATARGVAMTVYGEVVARRNAPTPEDRVQVIRIALYGMSTGADLDELRGRLEPLHPPHDTFPGEVLSRPRG